MALAATLDRATDEVVEPIAHVMLAEFPSASLGRQVSLAESAQENASPLQSVARELEAAQASQAAEVVKPHTLMLVAEPSLQSPVA